MLSLESADAASGERRRVQPRKDLARADALALARARPNSKTEGDRVNATVGGQKASGINPQKRTTRAPSHTPSRPTTLA